MSRRFPTLKFTNYFKGEKMILIIRCKLCGHEQKIVRKKDWKEQKQVFICESCGHIESLEVADIFQELSDQYREIINRRFKEDGN